MDNKLSKKYALLYGLFLLIMPSYGGLYAAKSAYQPSAQIQKADGVVGLPRAKRKLLVHGYCRKYDVPKEVGLFILYFVYDNPLKYKNKTLPNDLSEQDLSEFDFTGCQFTYTNLSYTKLANVVLTNTTCDYQKAFLDNIKKNKLRGGDWYKENLPKDLKSIAEVYPKLNNNTHKAKLLHIACGLSRLPFYESDEFCIKVQYWSCALLQFKRALGNIYSSQLTCSLGFYLNYDAKNYCWKTNYPKDNVNVVFKAAHANFDTYLSDFNNGLVQYNCTSYYSNGFCWYNQEIEFNIKGLQEAFPNIEDKKLQQEARDIAYGLSRSYQTGKYFLLYHYLFYQHRLIRLKELVNKRVSSDIYYRARPTITNISSWNAVREY